MLTNARQLKCSTAFLVLSLCIVAFASAADSPETFFETRVAPILVGQCLECHGEARKGGLDLRTSAALLEGGESGAVVQPGSPEESLLFQHVAAHEMPPKNPLNDAQVETLRAWIAEGPVFSDQPLSLFSATTERRGGFDWWSLQALKDATPPVLQDDESPFVATWARAWGDHPIDQFVFARLRETGLTPSFPAQPHDLIRRATYDLTGLPPTPEEVAAFTDACERETGSPNRVGDAAYAALVDRLLASPRYGEQWGRHWMDVARYGESTGYEVNHLIDNIWPYRDYLIKSFNDDKPFDQLVREQLAGDTVDPGNSAVEVGMTFLVCGPNDIVGNQDPVAAAQIRANTVDEMIRTTSEAFLGLTVGCARCHDHKFDAISQEDYHRFYASLAGVSHDDRDIATAEQRAEREEKIAPLTAERDALAQQRAAIDAAILARGEAKAAEYDAQWTRPPVDRRGTEETFAPVTAKFVRLLAEGCDLDPNARVAFRIDEFEVWSADAAPRNVALLENGGSAKGSATSPGDFAEAYSADLAIDGKYDARWVAAGAALTLEFAKPEEIDRIVFSSDRPAAVDLSSGEARFVSDYSLLASEDGEDWTEVANGRDRQPVNAAHRNRRLLDAERTEEDKEAATALDRQIGALNQQIGAVPAFPRLRVGRLEQPAAEMPIFLGGDPQRPGKNVVPAAIATLDRATGGYALAADAPEKDRRAALAEWITADNNPLPARVIANRIWQYHFGTGIVGTPSDFGFMGTPPSHPELLDWLAREIITPTHEPGTGDNAWRLKRLHRIIMLSQTYRQSTDYREATAKVDGDSRLLWRFPPRRLTGEELRDTMLAMAGQLNETPGGPGFRLYKYLRDNVSTYVPLEEFGPETYRRSVYHQTPRAARIDLLTEFDAPDCAFATPQRAETTSPMQALAMMNHQFTMDMADFLATRLEQDAPDNEKAWTDEAFELAFARTPSDAERATATSLIDEHGLRAFCRALFNLNELIYLN